MLPTFLVFTLALPALSFAALFPKDSKVKYINPKQFNHIMKQNRTVGVAFVAPWCGHCQNMAPEWSRAAGSLYPLIPLYAIDCDEQSNKALCAKEGVKGFPTVKMYPRGGKLPAVEYNSGARTATAFVQWITEKTPSRVNVLPKSDIPKFISKSKKPRAVLFTKDTRVPLLWQVLSVVYADRIIFASHHDKSGAALRVQLGSDDAATPKSTVVFYAARSEKAVQYSGANNFNSLSQYFDSILDDMAQSRSSSTRTSSPASTPSSVVKSPKKTDSATRAKATTVSSSVEHENVSTAVKKSMSVKREDAASSSSVVEASTATVADEKSTASAAETGSADTASSTAEEVAAATETTASPSIEEAAATSETAAAPSSSVTVEEVAATTETAATPSSSMTVEQEATTSGTVASDKAAEDLSVDADTAQTVIVIPLPSSAEESAKTTEELSVNPSDPTPICLTPIEEDVYVSATLASSTSSSTVEASTNTDVIVDASVGTSEAAATSSASIPVSTAEDTNIDASLAETDIVSTSSSVEGATPTASVFTSTSGPVESANEETSFDTASGTQVVLQDATQQSSSSANEGQRVKDEL